MVLTLNKSTFTTRDFRILWIAEESDSLRFYLRCIDEYSKMCIGNWHRACQTRRNKHRDRKQDRGTLFPRSWIKTECEPNQWYCNQPRSAATRTTLDVSSLKFIDCIAGTRFRTARARVQASFQRQRRRQRGGKKRDTESRSRSSSRMQQRLSHKIYSIEPIDGGCCLF